MIQPSPRTALFAAVAASLSLVAWTPAGALPNLLPRPAQPQPPTPVPTTVSPTQNGLASAGRAAGLRTGVLANGLRYAIERNTNFPAKASLRLRLSVGDLSESDAERGFSQLLARAPFDGSRLAPGGDLAELAKARGVTFTADGNADAAADATVFSLDLACTDPATLDGAIALLRGAVNEPKLAQSDIDREWTTVIAHEHASNDLANRLFRARLGFLLAGQSAAKAVGGLSDTLPKKVKRGPVEAFYHRFYRPQHAWLVVVGDIDADAVEKAIRDRFASWRSVGPPGSPPLPGSVQSRGPQSRLMTEAGLPSSLQLSYVAPLDTVTDMPEKLRREAVERLALGVVNARLAALAASTTPPFDSAAVFQNAPFGSARITSLLANTQPDHWREALTAADQTERAAITFGITNEEVKAARRSIESDLEDAIGSANGRPPALIADALAATLGDGDIVTTPEQDLARFDEATSAVTTDEITEALKSSFSGQGPLLFVTSPSSIEGGDATIAAALASVSAQSVGPPPPTSSDQGAFQDFGEPGRIVDRRDIIDLDTVFLRFENGVRLTFKPTKFEDGEVWVKVRVAGGLASMPIGQPPPIWALSSLLEGTQAVITAEDDALAMTGAIGRDDLETLLAQMARPLAAPAWKDDAFARAKAATLASIAQDHASAETVLAHALPTLEHGGDPRWASLEANRVLATGIADAKRPFASALANGAVEVVIVGDITEDKAIDAMAETFGAFPERPARPAGTLLGSAAPDLSAITAAKAPIVLTRTGGGDGRAATAWPIDDHAADTLRSSILQVLAEILRTRLAQSSSGSQAVVITGSPIAGGGLFYLALPGPALQIDALLGQEASAVEDLRARDVAVDELARATANLAQAEDRARAKNVHWLDLLSGAQDDPRRLTAIRSFDAALQRITPADIRAAAEHFLTPEAAVTIEVRPAGS